MQIPPPPRPGAGTSAPPRLRPCSPLPWVSFGAWRTGRGPCAAGETADPELPPGALCPACSPSFPLEPHRGQPVAGRQQGVGTIKAQVVPPVQGGPESLCRATGQHFIARELRLVCTQVPSAPLRTSKLKGSSPIGQTACYHSGTWYQFNGE